MSHKDVYKRFESYCTDYAGENVKEWFPNGKNSIRIRMNTGMEFIFTYNGPGEWCFETMRNYMKKMKGEKK